MPPHELTGAVRTCPLYLQRERFWAYLPSLQTVQKNHV